MVQKQEEEVRPAWGRRSKEEGTDGLWTSQMNTGQIAFHVTGSKTVFQKQSTRMLLWKKKIQILLLTLVTSSYQCSTSVPLSTLLIKSHVRYARVSCWAPPLCPEGAVRSTASLSQRPYLSQFHHSALLQSLVNLVHILNDACTVLDVCI